VIERKRKFRNNSSQNTETANKRTNMAGTSNQTPV